MPVPQQGHECALRHGPAARQRLRPILMTSLCFILGVVLLVLSSGAGSGAQNAPGHSRADRHDHGHGPGTLFHALLLCGGEQALDKEQVGACRTGRKVWQPQDPLPRLCAHVPETAARSGADLREAEPRVWRPARPVAGDPAQDRALHTAQSAYSSTSAQTWHVHICQKNNDITKINIIFNFSFKKKT